MGGRHSRPLKRPLTRSENMARIRGRDTGPERLLRSLLWRAGFRFRLAARIGRVQPDLVLPSHRVAVFVDGCFWHGCPAHYVRPRTSMQFWAKKLRENVERDRRQTSDLEKAGWGVLRYWEHEVFTRAAAIAADVTRQARSPGRRSREPAWRAVRVESVAQDGQLERWNLVTLRDPLRFRTVERKRTTAKW